MGILRLLLALSVVTAHCGSIFGCKLVGGPIAVQSFYIISGFYMTLILNEKYIGKNNSYKLFITNRFIRLYPIYWAVLLITIFISAAVACITHGNQIPKFDNYFNVESNLISFSFLFITNIFIVGQDIVMFLGITPETGNLFFTSNFALTNPRLQSFLFIPQAWTLSLEIMFYIIAPFILRRKMLFIILLIIVSFILRLFIYNHLELQNDPWTYRFFPTELCFFLLGYISYRIYFKLPSILKTKRAGLLTLIFIVIFTMVYYYLPEINIKGFPYSLFQLSYFIGILFSIPILFSHFKKVNYDNAIGDLSFPVYICHMLILDVCSNLPNPIFTSGWFIAVITLIMAAILNRIIAIPVELYRQSRLH